MPTTVININAVEESTARAIKRIEEQENALNAIDSIVNSMEGVWESDAQKVYADRFREAKTRIQNFNASLSQSLENMRTFVSDCVMTDNQTARELRNVSW